MQFKRSMPRQRNRKNPYEEDSTNKHGDMSETNTMQRLSARQTMASGALAHNKSDGTLDKSNTRRYRIENKATIHESLSIKRAWLVKICKEALETGRDPMMTLQFTDSNGLPKKDGNWVMMRESDFLEMIDKGSLD